MKTIIVTTRVVESGIQELWNHEDKCNTNVKTILVEPRGQE